MASSSLRTEIPLKKRKIIKKSFHGVLKVFYFMGPLSLLLYAYFFSGYVELSPRLEENKWAIFGYWLLLVALFVFNEMIYHILYFITYYYEMDDKNLVIRKGVVVRKEITLPFSKITDVYVDQDVGDFLLGLYDVYISTPTAESGKFAHIDGVNKKGSVKLRQMILDAVNRETARNP